MFYGREDELAELNRRYNSKGFQFIPVYGRRRVGKTALIDEFIKDKTAVKYTAVKGSYSTNMRLLSSIVLGVKNAPAMNFEDILETMHSRFGGRRYVFVIDEYPYLVKSEESVTGILNNFIESHLDSQVFIILSGSSMNIMKNQILGKKSPLYGRRTGQMKLNPFP
ncbi:MAG: ATP-binding protein, partial [Candidatus Methanomethylophilaceae archaeon]|nr:ATP-binding protein [Candidatus Methanomethylophilaceae archaeon]